MEVREIAHNSSDYALAVELRRLILRIPLGLDFTADELATEVGDYHIAAMEGIELLGCLVLSPRGEAKIKMRQVAVTPGRQGQGIGAEMVRFSEDFSREKGYREMVLSARETVVPFYVSLGYEPIGEIFEEVTIPHQTMRKSL